MGAQLFTPRADLACRTVIVGVLGLVGTAAGGTWVWSVSSWSTGADQVVDQPVPFSHAHHVGGLGIDCRYCHGAVERGPQAGLPDTDTCMGCHRQMWTTAAILAPVRASWRTGRPLRWRRVHSLPDHVYFDHSVHVRQGIGCSTCHGRIDRMPLVHQTETLLMQWCLDCHRDPAPHVRPREQVFAMDWVPPPDQEQRGRELMEEYGIEAGFHLTNCTVCHR